MKTTMLRVGMLIAGMLVGGVLGLVIALPPSSVECGDACGGRALSFAFRCALLGGGLFVAMAWALAKARRRRSNR